MILDSILDLFGIGLEIDPVTGINVNAGLVGVEVSPTGSTVVDLLGGELVGVDLADGVSVDVLSTDIVGVDLTTGTGVEVLGNSVVVDSAGNVAVDVANELVSVDATEGTAAVEVAGTLVDLDLTQGVLAGIGEEILFADLSEAIAIAPDLLTEAGIELPITLDS